MIRIFTGDWRGPQLSEKRTFIQIDVRFREILHKFKGAKLAILLDIMLHVDADGVAFPSYDLIESESGYGRGTIAAALDELCKMEIDGAPVLMRWRERAKDGTFDGPNRYKIFPTKEEIGTQSSENPTLEKSTSGESVLEVDPSAKEEPSNTAKSKNGDNLQKSVTRRTKTGRTRAELDALYDVVQECFFGAGFESGYIAKVRKRIMEVKPDVVPSDIRKFWGWWQGKYPNCELKSLDKVEGYFRQWLYNGTVKSPPQRIAAPCIDPVDLTDEQRKAAASKLDAARDRMRET